MKNDFEDGLTIFLSALAIMLLFFAGVMIERHANHKCPTQLDIPKNKELIQLNDTTYARIHVRVDTTYYYEH